MQDLKSQQLLNSTNFDLINIILKNFRGYENLEISVLSLIIKTNMPKLSQPRILVSYFWNYCMALINQLSYNLYNTPKDTESLKYTFIFEARMCSNWKIKKSLNWWHFQLKSNLLKKMCFHLKMTFFRWRQNEVKSLQFTTKVLWVVVVL